MSNIKISSLKKQAKLKRKNNNNIKNQSDSLNVIAREKGYKNWQELLNSAEIRIKTNIQNYHFLSKEELDSLSLEDLEKHHDKINKQYQKSIKEDQTVESIQLNEIALKYLKNLFKKLQNISDEDWEIVLEIMEESKNNSMELSELMRASSEEYKLIEDDFLNYDNKEKIKLKNKIKTEDDYSFCLYLQHLYQNNQIKVSESLLNKSKIFCNSFINLITAARTNNVLEVDFDNVNNFLNINCLENLLWNEKIIKELKTEMLLFLEDIGYQLKTPLEPNPKNSVKVLKELNFYFKLMKFKR